MICKCCHNEFDEFITKDSICEYCGFDNVEALDDEGEKRIQEDAGNHRKKILSTLYGFSVRASRCRYDEKTNRLVDDGTLELFDPKLDGSYYCGNSPQYSKDWIAHFKSGDEIYVKYKFGETDKEAKPEVRLIPCDGIWYLGLHINDILQLELWLKIKPVEASKKTETMKIGTVKLDLHD